MIHNRWKIVTTSPIRVRNDCHDFEDNAVNSFCSGWCHQILTNLSPNFNAWFETVFEFVCTFTNYLQTNCSFLDSNYVVFGRKLLSVSILVSNFSFDFYGAISWVEQTSLEYWSLRPCSQYEKINSTLFLFVSLHAIHHILYVSPSLRICVYPLARLLPLLIFAWVFQFPKGKLNDNC